MARWLLLFLLFAGAAALARGGIYGASSPGLEVAFWVVFGLAAVVGVYFMLSAEHRTTDFND